MRKHSLYSSFFLSNTKTEYESCIVTSTSVSTCSDSSASYASIRSVSTSTAFISCTWSSCVAGNGGAIYVSTSTIDLELTNCCFSSCEASAHNGGGIYAQPARIVHIDSSQFSECTALYGDGLEDGGGAMWISNISTEIRITATNIISCATKYDAQGVAVWYSNSTQGHKQTFYDCRFVNCKGSKGEGGGIIAWDNGYSVGISSTLFSCCSNHDGGAFKMNPSTSSQPPFISFCFFHGNTAITGNDIFFSSQPASSLLLQCFSTIPTARIYHGEDSWLPLTNAIIKVFDPITSTNEIVPCNS